MKEIAKDERMEANTLRGQDLGYSFVKDIWLAQQMAYQSQSVFGNLDQLNHIFRQPIG